MMKEFMQPCLGILEDLGQKEKLFHPWYVFGKERTCELILF